MLAPTHMIGGQFAYLFASWMTGHIPTLPEAALAAVVALMPDVDHGSGTVGRYFPWLSRPLEYWTGHRTATHSVIALALAAVLCWLFVPPGWSMAIIAGLSSHAILDMMTPSGVAWFWPARARCVIPGDQRWRMQAMGKGELAFAIILFVLSTPVLLAAERGVGLLGTVRDIVGDIESARQHYDARKSEANWWLKIEGQDNQRFVPVEGRYRVIGPYKSDGLILKTPEGPVSVCLADDCDWYAGRAVLERGEPIETTTRQISAEGATVPELLDSLKPLEQAGDVFLLGSIRGEGFDDDEPTIQSSGDVISLRYATLGQLQKQQGEVERANLLVQVRHEPGVGVPEPGPLQQRDEVEERDLESIDPLLEGYLP